MNESFEGAQTIAQAMMADCDMPILNNLQRAHEHDMEHLRKSRFHDGYVAGQKSMDAEHRAVAMRLRALSLDEDSHGNLSQIAGAIWNSDFGWTRGACKELRDELIRLLGGVHGDIDVPNLGHGDTRGDCDCGGCEQPQVVAYDELGKERNNAVLQKTIDKMVEEHDKLRAMLTQQRDEARAKVLRLESENAEWRRGAERDADKLESLTGAYNDAVSEREELQKKLNGARGAIRHLTSQWDISNKKRRELQERLDAVREALDG